MSDENVTPGLPDDWQPPLRGLQQKVWADQPDENRKRLEALVRERDEKGNRAWEEGLEPDPDDETWTVLVLRTVDPRDPRPNVRIGRWPNSVPAEAEARAQAIVDEHHLE
jgi:hypothetical protein